MEKQKIKEEKEGKIIKKGESEVLMN